ncbi:hypothetical protein H4R35_001558 [Dimargaris xerosporica]|nr:hypothetical protein H4R35_001558 [Dimargaris xerosporica]
MVRPTNCRSSADTDALSQVTVNDHEEDACSLKPQLSQLAWANNSSQSVSRLSLTTDEKHQPWSYDPSDPPSLHQPRPSLTRSSSDRGLQAPLGRQEPSTLPLNGRSSGLHNRAVDPLLPGSDHSHPGRGFVASIYEASLQRPVMVEICPWEISSGASPPAASIAPSTGPAGRPPWSAATSLALRSDATPTAHTLGLINGPSLSIPRTINPHHWTGEKIAAEKAGGPFQCQAAQQAAAFRSAALRQWIWQRHPAFWAIIVILLLTLVATVLVGGQLSGGQVCQRGLVQQVPLCQAVIVAQCQQVRPCGDPLQYYLTLAGECACK